MDLRFVDLVNECVALLLHFAFHALSLLVAKFTPLDDTIDLFFDFLVLFIKLVRLRAQIIHIVIQTIVLLLGLNERLHCLFDRADTCALTDLVKGVLHCGHVLDILVHQFLLAFVGGDDLGQSES